jgi:hypothetical protein
LTAVTNPWGGSRIKDLWGPESELLKAWPGMAVRWPSGRGARVKNVVIRCFLCYDDSTLSALRELRVQYEAFAMRGIHSSVRVVH